MDGREIPRRLVDHGLTERELEVLELLVGGLRDREIADRLGIATGTVRAHLAGARDKLAARSRVDLAVRALRGGIIALEPLDVGNHDDI
jgi:DNA-binding CsgD family transcriptional regulator